MSGWIRAGAVPPVSEVGRGSGNKCHPRRQAKEVGDEKSSGIPFRDGSHPVPLGRLVGLGAE